MYNTAGVQLLKIEHYVVPKRTLYMPHPASHFPWVDQEYDARGRPTKWEWGGKKDIIRYDQQVNGSVTPGAGPPSGSGAARRISSVMISR